MSELKHCYVCGKSGQWRYSWWAEAYCTDANCANAVAVALNDYPTDEEAVEAVIQKWNAQHEREYL